MKKYLLILSLLFLSCSDGQHGKTCLEFKYIMGGVGSIVNPLKPEIECVKTLLWHIPYRKDINTTQGCYGAIFDGDPDFSELKGKDLGFKKIDCALIGTIPMAN